jgi:hypothetical protein
MGEYTRKGDKVKKTVQTTTPDTLPAPGAFLECAGTWEFEPGELEEILQDIEQSRLIEIEEQHNVSHLSPGTDRRK